MRQSRKSALVSISRNLIQRSQEGRWKRRTQTPRTQPMNGTLGSIYSSHGGDSLLGINSLFSNDELEPTRSETASVNSEKEGKRVGQVEGIA